MRACRRKRYRKELQSASLEMRDAGYRALFTETCARDPTLQERCRDNKRLSTLLCLSTEFFMRWD